MVAPAGLGLDLAATVDLPVSSPAALVQSAVRGAAGEGFAAVVAPAGWIPADGGPEPGAVALTAACGYPTGRHHDLVVASEARLAVQFGANAVLVVLDAAQPGAGEEAALRRLVMCREAVSDQVELSAAIPVGMQSLEEKRVLSFARTAAAAGADAVRVQPAAWGTPAGDASAAAEVVRCAVGLAGELGGKLAVRAGIGDAAPGLAARLVGAGVDRVDSLDPWALLEDEALAGQGT